jgi:hypothetical protein
MMECFCDYESPAVYSATTPKARKEHQCSECSRAVIVGEQYERVWGVWDGRQDTYRTCQRCLNLRAYVKAHVPCFCWAHGNMIEDAMETAEGWNREAPGLLFGAYRLKIKIRRNRRAALSQCVEGGKA